MASDVSKSEAELVLVACAIHSTESLELYCKDHELALCRICRILKHKKCNVETITDVFKNIDVSEALKEASTQITTLGQAVITSKTVMQSLLDKIDKEKTEMEENIESIRNRLNGILDRYKEQLNSKLMSERETLTVTIQACECLSDQIENQKKSLEKVKENDIQEIVSLTEAKHLYKELHHIAEEMDKEIKDVKIYIREDAMLPELIKELTNLGEKGAAESEEIQDGVDDKQGQYKTFLDIKSCTADHQTDIKLPHDGKVPNITGCCFLPNDEVVICDQHNGNLKFLDKEMAIKFTLPFLGTPKDVAQFDDSSIVVLYGLNYLQFVCIKPGIILKQKTATDWQCFGLESLDKIVYVSVFKSESKCYGIAGFVKSGGIITCNSFTPLIGSELQNLCFYLNVNIEKHDMYYMFFGRSKDCHFINKFSSKGHGIFSMCTTSLKNPKSIISDSAGNMLICDTYTKSVHIIDSKGKVGNTVLTETDDFGPTAMCLNASRDTLIVASSQKDSSKITVYRLNYD